MNKIVSLLFIFVVLLLIITFIFFFVSKPSDPVKIENSSLIDLSPHQLQSLDAIRVANNIGVTYLDSDGGYNVYVKGISQGAKEPDEDVCVDGYLLSFLK